MPEVYVLHAIDRVGQVAVEIIMAELLDTPQPVFSQEHLGPRAGDRKFGVLYQLNCAPQVIVEVM